MHGKARQIWFLRSPWAPEVQLELQYPKTLLLEQCWRCRLNSFRLQSRCTDTRRLVAVVNAASISVKFILVRLKVMFTLVTAWICWTSLQYTVWGLRALSILQEILPHYEEEVVQRWPSYLFHPALALRHWEIRHNNLEYPCYRVWQQSNP